MQKDIINILIVRVILQVLQGQLVHLVQTDLLEMTVFLACLVSVELMDRQGQVGFLDQMVFRAFQAFQVRLEHLELAVDRLRLLPAVAEEVVVVAAVLYTCHTFQSKAHLKTSIHSFKNLIIYLNNLNFFV
jgi:hypothetical protein